MKGFIHVSLSAATASLSLAASLSAPAAPPSIVVEVSHTEERSGTVTLEVAGAPPCVIVLKGDGKSREECTLPLPATVTVIRLSGEVRWKDGQKGRQVSKGTQSWKVLDLGPVAAPLRDGSRPFGSRMKGLVAALGAFEKGAGELVEPSAYLVDAGEKGTAASVAAAEKRLGYSLPPDYANLVVDFGVPQLGDSYFERPEKLASAFEQMVTRWGTPRSQLEKGLSAKTKALYRSGTLLYTEVGDGLGGLLYRPAGVPECGGKAGFWGVHQDDLDSPELLRAGDGSCRSFLQSVLWILSEQLFQGYDDTGDAGVVVDRSAPAPFRLTLYHEGGTTGPGFRLKPDWPRYE